MGCLFDFIESYPIKQKRSAGTHLGEYEICRKWRPPRAENFASEILSSGHGFTFIR